MSITAPPADLLPAAERVARAQATERRRWLRTRWGLSAPAVIIIALFGILPLLIMVVYSCLEAGEYGGVVWNFSTDAYVSFLFQRDIFDGTLTFSPDYLLIYARSIILAVVTTVICLALGFPTAYFMATRPPSQRTLWVFLITIPFWSNLLVRTLAVMLIIRDEGIKGVVLRLNAPVFSEVKASGQSVRIGCGAAIATLISAAAHNGLTGLEHLVGMPGTVGGALRHNAGGKSGEIGKFVKSVDVMDGQGAIVSRDRDELRFSVGGSNLDDPVLPDDASRAYGGVIGGPAWSGLVVTLDFPRARMWVR